MENLPNILSCSRIAMAPLMLYFAWTGNETLFIVFLITSLITDAVDGFIARQFEFATQLGARLDSLGDMVLYLSIPFCAWWLYLDLLQAEAIYVYMAISSYVIPLAAGIIKFKKMPSYHTIGAKTAAVLMSIALLIFFIAKTAWPFRIVAVFQAFVACEEVIITLWLDTLQSNVKSIWHLRHKTGKSSVENLDVKIR